MGIGGVSVNSKWHGFIHRGGRPGTPPTTPYDTLLSSVDVNCGVNGDGVNSVT